MKDIKLHENYKEVMQGAIFDDEYVDMVRCAMKEVSSLIEENSEYIINYTEGCIGLMIIGGIIRLDFNSPLVNLYDSKRDGMFKSKKELKEFLLDNIKYEMNKFVKGINSLKF